MALNMGPTPAIKNFTDLSSGNPETLSQIYLRRTMVSEFAQGQDITVCKARTGMPFALRSMACAVQSLVSVILSSCCPSKIIGNVVSATTVIVGRFVERTWRWSMEGLADEAMYRHRFGAASKAYVKPTCSGVDMRGQYLAPVAPTDDNPINRADASKIRRFIALMIAYRPPYFGCVAHDNSFRTMMKE